MFQFLSEADLNAYNDIARCRRLDRDLTLEEEFAKRLLAHDWHYAYSDDHSVWRAGKHAEEDLLEEIEESDLARSVKVKLSGFFKMDHDKRNAALKEYDWLRQMQYAVNPPHEGMLGLVFKGITDVEFAEFLQLKEMFEQLSNIISKSKLGDRLLMTDDTLSNYEIKCRAFNGSKERRDWDDFYFGITLPDVAQNLLDRIVRDHKTTFVRMVEEGAARVLFRRFGHKVEEDGTWLITMSVDGIHTDNFGFFIKPWQTAHRAAEYKSTLKKPTDRNPILDLKGKELPEEGRDGLSWSGAGSLIDPKTVDTGRVSMEKPNLPSKPVLAMPKAKPVPQLSNRPMVMDTAPKAKVAKTAPKKRKKFGSFQSLADLKG